MTIERVIVCDGCKKSGNPETPWGMPHGWFTIEIESQGSSTWARKKMEVHACSEDCVGAILRTAANEFDPPKAALPASGHPFR